MIRDPWPPYTPQVMMADYDADDDVDDDDDDDDDADDVDDDVDDDDYDDDVDDDNDDDVGDDDDGDGDDDDDDNDDDDGDDDDDEYKTLGFTAVSPKKERNEMAPLYSYDRIYTSAIAIIFFYAFFTIVFLKINVRVYSRSLANFETCRKAKEKKACIV